jgi:peptidoglycan L-alanyl-D-glutamate endopeptidase CwlK|tara:strand:- start:1270 stop:1719 length:450 start_codon:yes stop_codon:yes gene_type:complete
MFMLSARSNERLEGVNSLLVKVVKKAITVTTVDFGVICGRRTLEEQQSLFAKGATKTMKSKHLEGKAVDLMAYIDGRASWEINVYDEVADAMAEAARECNAAVRWGGAWTTANIAAWEGTMEEAMMNYIDIRRGEGKRPFIDGPHFELM